MISHIDFCLYSSLFKCLAFLTTHVRLQTDRMDPWCTYKVTTLKVQILKSRACFIVLRHGYVLFNNMFQFSPRS